ncbi:MAG: PEP-utilizing enzyme [Acidimicrobiales bacterium]
MTSSPEKSPLEWEPPGPGSWEFDAAHQLHPYPAAMLDWALGAAEDGFRAGFALIGMPLDRMAMRAVHGWVYMHAVPAGAPDTGGSPPPKLVLALLFRLLPELRRRHATARSVFVERPWNDIVDAWESSGRATALARYDQMCAHVPADGTDGELATLLVDVHRAAADAYRTHFTHAAPAAAATGRFAIRHAELTGDTVDDAFELLAGYSPATSEPLKLLDQIVAALPPDFDLDDDPEAAVAAIGQCPTDAPLLLSDYLRRYGDTIVAGESPLDPTLRELPIVIVSSLQARRRRSPQPESDLEDAGHRRTEAARLRVPSEHRAEWDQLLGDARRVTSLRDDDAGIALRWVGRSRRVLQEVGHRLHRRGILEHPESAFDLDAAELVELLVGRSDSTNADDRRRARLVADQLTPPPNLGPLEDAPYFDLFPPAVAAIAKCVFAYIERLGAPRTGEGLTGLGIGREAVTGTARIIADLTDLARVGEGDVIVTAMTTPVFNATIASAAALVCDHGGVTSHAAIMAREFAVPAVVGTRTATIDLVDGELVTVDPRAGTVTRVETHQTLAATE